MSALQQFTDRIRDSIVARYDLVEVGDPYEVLALTDTGARVGEVRVWTGPTIPKLVDSRLTVAEKGIDSVMLHAFADSATTAPHLTSDVAGFDGRLALGLDLTPRVDLAAEPAYLDAVYAPLSDAHAAAAAIDGARPMDVPLRLRAFTSPWMTGVSLTDDRLDAIQKVYDVYLDRFFALLEDGTPAVGEIDLVARDRLVRRAQFDPASDGVWDHLAAMLGQSSIDTLLELVREPGPPLPR